MKQELSIPETESTEETISQARLGSHSTSSLGSHLVSSLVSKLTSHLVSFVLIVATLASPLFIITGNTKYFPDYTKTEWIPAAIKMNGMFKIATQPLSIADRYEKYEMACTTLQLAYNKYRKELWVNEHEAPPYTSLFQQVKELICYEYSILPKPTDNYYPSIESMVY